MKNFKNSVILSCLDFNQKDDIFTDFVIYSSIKAATLVLYSTQIKRPKAVLPALYLQVVLGPEPLGMVPATPFKPNTPTSR